MEQMVAVIKKMNNTSQTFHLRTPTRHLALLYWDPVFYIITFFSIIFLLQSVCEASQRAEVLELTAGVKRQKDVQLTVSVFVGSELRIKRFNGKKFRGK